MSDEPKNGKRFPINGGIIALIFVGIQLAMVVINLVVSSGYTAKADFIALKDGFDTYKLSNNTELSQIREKNTENLSKIANGITELNSRMKDNERQDATIADHERRIREVERAKK